MPAKKPKKEQDENTDAVKLVEGVTGKRKPTGESLLGSSKLRRLLEAAKKSD